MVYRYALWILFFAFCETDSPKAQSLPYRRLLIPKVGDTPLPGIADMVEDDRGFLWLGGGFALYKYDGTSLEAYTNRPDDSTSIVAGAYVQIKKSNQGEGLWIGSSTSGMSHLDLRTGRAINYCADPSNAGALAGNEIAGIYEDPAGGLWVGTNQFTLHYLPPPTGDDPRPMRFQRFRPTLPAGSTADFVAAGPLGEIIPDGHDPNVLWVGARTGVYRFNITDHTFRLFPIGHTVVYWYRPMNMQLIMDPGGFIWCGSYNTGLCRLDPATGQWKNFKKKGAVPALVNDNTIQDIVSLDDSTLLVLTNIDDAWKVDWKQCQVEYLKISSAQPPAGRPYPLLCARRTSIGDIWLSSTDGLIRLTKQAPVWGNVFFPDIDPKLDRNNWQRAYALAPDGRSLYMGTLRGNGLLRFDLESQHIDVCHYRKLSSPALTDVFMDALCFDTRGCLWIGSDTGLLYLPKNERQIRRFTGTGYGITSLQDAHIAALALQKENLWIGTKARGVFCLDMSNNTIRAVPVEGLTASSSINALLVDRRGRLWIGHDLGLTVFEPGTNQARNFNRKIKPPAGLSSDQVTGLAIDSAGHLWISSLGGGMMRLRQADPEHPYIDTYYNTEVPGGNLIYDFVLCNNGKLWLGAQSGMVVLDTALRTFVNYDARDGLSAKLSSTILLPDGRIASGVHRGISLFYPDSVLHSGPPPVPYLKRFRVFDKDMDLPLQIDRMNKLTLAHDQNHFSIELGALNFGENDRTRFAYRLEGYDHDWISSGERSYLSYTNLPAGNYTLRVKAANKHGVWSEREKTVSIRIRPPYWQTGWFSLGLISLLLLLTYSLYQAWLQRKRALKAQYAVEYFAHAEYKNVSVRDILWDVSHRCMARLDLEDCVIYLLDESGEYLVQEAAYGAKSPQLYELKDPLRIPLGQGIVGSAGLKGQPELVPDTRRDPRYIVDDQPRLSELAVPILHEGRVIGVIDSEHSRRGFFTSWHVNTLKTIASLCADKIAHGRTAELVKEKERQLNELNRNLAESQLTALRAQMNPHFLFNCLNSINWYIIKNRPAEASRYISRFSRLIRLILEHSKNRQITLTQEMEALRLYLDMEAMRFEQRFEYRIDLDPALDPEEMLLPPMIFQPFVENAIWHGLMPKNGPGYLHLTLWQENECLICTIEDNGIGRAASEGMRNHTSFKRQSQGLKITEARIRQINGQTSGPSPVQFTDLYDRDGQAVGTRVEVRVG